MSTDRGVVFSATDSAVPSGVAHGRELWITDGTAAGTRLLADITPGTTGFDPVPLASIGDRLFVVDASTRRSLKSVDLSSGAVSDWATLTSAVVDSVVLGSRLIFAVDGSSNGSLYATNAAPSNGITVLATLAESSASTPISLEAFGGKIFFAGYASATGNELWSTDGTVAGTSLFKNARIGSASTNPTQLTASGSTLYFRGLSATEPVTRIWKSDGTAAGTVEIATTQAFSTADAFVASSTGIAFRYSNAIWRSNGTSAGTFQLAPQAYYPSAPYSDPSGTLYWSQGSGPFMLYRSDGSTSGTSTIAAGTNDAASRFVSLAAGRTCFQAGSRLFVTDGISIVPLMAPSDSTSTQSSATFGGKWIFAASNLVTGAELFSSDGTPSGTGLLRDIIDFPTGSTSAYNFTRSPDMGRAYFWAKDDYIQTQPYAATNPTYSFYVTDGTPAGTKALMRSNQGSHPGTLGDRIVVLDNGKAIFMADGCDGSGRELWVSDGTVAGTRRLADISPGATESIPRNFFAAGNLVYFVANAPGLGYELWRTDGTESGTFCLGDLYPGEDGWGVFPTDSAPPVALANGKLAFFARRSSSAYTLMVTDGTVAGTVPLLDGFMSIYAPDPPTSVGGRFYFLHQNATLGTEPWVSDGSIAGTYLLKDIYVGSGSSYAGWFRPFKNQVVFSAADAATGYEPWITDSTEAGTHRIADLIPGNINSTAYIFGVAGDRMFISVSEPNYQWSYWVSDGTPSGTHLLTPDGRAGAMNSGRFPPTTIGGVIVYLGFDSVFGNQLYRTDGTVEGTYRLTESLVTPQDGSASNAAALVASNIGGRIWINCSVPGNANQLWTTDGTRAGTSPYPSPPDGAVTALAQVNGKAVGIARSATYGDEPFAFDASFAPVFNAVEYRWDGSVPEITLSSTTDLGSSFTPSDVQLLNRSTNSTIPVSQLSLTYDATTKLWSLRYTGSPDGALPDGAYTLRIATGSVVGNGGLPLAQDVTQDFFVLAGDANHDRMVNFNDLLLLAQNYGQSGKTFSQGNFNYSADGKVDFDDLLILAQKYNTASPAVLAVTPSKRKASAWHTL